MVNIDDFVAKVYALEKYISISVGVVGNPNDIEEIIELRKKIPKNVYMWINAMEGLGREYTIEEIGFFVKIDPMFTSEITRQADYNCNCCREHIFVNFNGNIQSCNRKKELIGNIYKSDFIKNSECNGNCYLSYSHTNNFRKNNLIGENNLFRIPKKIRPKAIFFDVDGTLTGR